MPLSLTKVIKPSLPDIRAPLHAMLARYEPGRPATRLHASSITKQDPEFCAREAALRAMMEKVPDEFLTTADQMTFEMGRQIQETVTHWYADAGLAVGDWKCKHCGTMYPFQKRPFKCATTGCGHKYFQYEEIRITSPLTLASCGLDVLLDLGMGKHFIVELKTMAPDYFKKLVAPMGEHKLRTALYLQSVAESEDPRTKAINTDAAYVMYVVKGGWGSQEPLIKTWGITDGPWSPFKLYTVHRDDKLVEPYAKRAREYKAWIDGKGLPHRICQNSFEKRAKACSRMMPCFSGKYQ